MVNNNDNNDHLFFKLNVKSMSRLLHCFIIWLASSKTVTSSGAGSHQT